MTPIGNSATDYWAWVTTAKWTNQQIVKASEDSTRDKEHVESLQKMVEYRKVMKQRIEEKKQVSFKSSRVTSNEASTSHHAIKELNKFLGIKNHIPVNSCLSLRKGDGRTISFLLRNLTEK